MKLKTYKTLYGYYNGPCENNINLPENIKLVYDDGEIGDGLTNGHNHYIGFIKYTDDITEEELDELNTFGQEAIKFGDLLMITISNTKFIDEPPIYTYQEMMKEFELDRYFIAFKTHSTFPEDFIKNGDFSKESIEKNVIPGKWVEIHKIVSIKGPYSVDLFSINNWDDLFSSETYSISFNRHENINRYVNSLHETMFDKFDSFIMKDEWDLFNEMKDNVLNKVNYTRPKEGTPDSMEHITEESIKKIQKRINNESYFCDKNFEEKVINDMVNILNNDKKFQEFSNQTMKKIILGEL